MMRVLLILLVTTAFAFAQDAELTNHRSDLHLTFGIGDGSDKGTAYAEEYPYHDKTVWDQKVTYIKSDTLIAMSVRSGSQIESGRTKLFHVDRDLNFGIGWTPANAYVRTYTTPFTFASMQYDDGSPVVGTTGAKPGIEWNHSTKQTYYWRGVLDSVGDEWHTISATFYKTTGDHEYKANHGKMWLFVVNPKTPCLSVRATGNGQFYTTPAKFYFIPKIHDQTTYFNAGTGTVTFELRDINGNDVWYRINGGSWVDAGANNVTLDQDDFSAGSNTLEYYYEGNAAYTKTRTIVKNPTHPSAGETHGQLMWGSSDILTKYNSNKLVEGPTKQYRNSFLTNSSYHQCTNSFATSSLVQGRRMAYNPALSEYELLYSGGPRGQLFAAFFAYELGLSAVPSGTDGSKTWADFAKMMLLYNRMRIDPVGLEQASSGPAIPSRDIKDRGYYTVGTRGRVIETMLAYDLLISIFKSTQHANGITPVEDYYIRDRLAAWVQYARMMQGGYVDTAADYPNSSGGMWDRSDAVGAMVAAYAMPSYSTPYFGTCGLDGNTTTYSGIPFPIDSTWKDMFIDEDGYIGNYPNPVRRLELDKLFYDETKTLTDSTTGIVYDTPYAWLDRQSYADQQLAGFPTFTAAMMSKLHGGINYPRLEGFIERGKIGQAWSGKKNSDEPFSAYGPFTMISGYVANSLFPTNSAEYVANQTSYRLGRIYQHGYIPALLWYDISVSADPSGDVTPPTVLSASINDLGDTLIINYSEPVVGVDAAHYTLSGGHTLGTASGVGPQWQFPISPVVVKNVTRTLGYTSGAARTEDEAGNDLDTITSGPVTNYSIQTTPQVPGRRGRANRNGTIIGR